MLIVPVYIYRATMLSRDKQLLMDADTFWMDVDLGLRVHAYWKIRMRNYSCPERTTAEGVLAREYAHNILYAAKALIVQTYRDRLSYDRWVEDICRARASTLRRLLVGRYGPIPGCGRILH